MSPSIPTPVSRTTSRTWGPGRRPTCCRANPSSSRTKPVSSVSRPPRGIASRALTARLTIICSSWAGIRPDAARRRIEAGGEGDVLADEAAQHRLHAADDLVQVDDARLHHLLPAEGEELPGEGGGPVRRLLDQLDVAAERALGRELEQEELAPARDHGQEVVEVVGDAAGEPADRLHLLGVAELRLERPHRGEVAHDDDDPEVLLLAALQRGRRDLDGHDAAQSGWAGSP